MQLFSQLLLISLLIPQWVVSQQKEKPWMIGPFEKVDSLNPIMGRDTTTLFYCPVRKKMLHWEAKDVFNPTAVVKDGKVFMLYRAEDYEGKYKGTSRIGLAYSPDGLNFIRNSTPVLYPNNDSFNDWEWEGGVEDPRIVEDEDKTYYMTYNAWNGIPGGHLSLATSKDLLHWTKRGIMANINGETNSGGGYKAGSIVCRREGDRLIATRINGKYWMYWGVGTLRLATSDNLIHWERVQDADGNDMEVLKPRRSEEFKNIDNLAVEGGAIALLTGDGIVVMYNGIYNPLPEEERVPTKAGPRFGNGWCGAQALFDKNDPAKLIDRATEPSIKPDRPYELRGQIPNVTFVEGMIYFQDKWFVYYGTADSFIAVATTENK